MNAARKNSRQKGRGRDRTSNGEQDAGGVQDGQPLLSAKDVAVYFPVGSALAARIRHEQRLLHAVDGVDLDLARGEAMALVGESGSGNWRSRWRWPGMRPTDRGDQLLRALLPVPAALLPPQAQ